MTGIVIPEQMTHFQLPAGEDTLRFHGYLFEQVDNDTGDRLRWAELRYYRFIDTNPAHDDSLPEGNPDRGTYGAELRLLYTVGHSLVVHSDGSECNQGTRVRARDFAKWNTDHEDLEGCRRCRPGDWGKDPDVFFELETTWYSWTRCQSAQRFVDALRKPAQCAHCSHRRHRDACGCGCPEYAEGDRPISSPGLRLIRAIGDRDPEVAAAARETREL